MDNIEKSKYQEIVDKNCEIISEFYQSDFYKRYPNFIYKIIFQALYIDPDSAMKDRVFIDGKEILLSGDAVLSAKKIYEHNSGKKDWINEYKEYRDEKYAILKWPRHKVPTINTQRQACFNDKIDFTLLDIRMFYSLKKEKSAVKEKCKMWKALIKEDTYEWLRSFANFKKFIDENNLTMFVKESVNHSDYDVINIENGGILTSTDTYVPKWSSEYYENLQKILKDNIF